MDCSGYWFSATKHECVTEMHIPQNAKLCKSPDRAEVYLIAIIRAFLK